MHICPGGCRSQVEVVHCCSEWQGAPVESCQKPDQHYRCSPPSLLSSRVKFTATVCRGSFSTASLLPQRLIGTLSPPGAPGRMCLNQHKAGADGRRVTELIASEAHTERCDKMTSQIPRRFLSLSEPGLCLLPILESISQFSNASKFWICLLFVLLTVWALVCSQVCRQQSIGIQRSLGPWCSPGSATC